MAEPNTDIKYTSSDIDRYLNGSMTAKEMHEMERAALQDPFLADAIEGYRVADKQQAEQHLNEIAAAIQGKREETKVITLPKKKNFTWQIAAAVIIFIGIGIFLLMNSSSNNKEKPLANNDLKKEERKDSFTDESAKPSSPLPESSVTLAPASKPVAKQKQMEENGKMYFSKKEKSAQDVAVSRYSKDDTASPVASAPSASSGRMEADKSMAAPQQRAAPVMADTSAMNNSLAEVVVTGYATRKINPTANGWTTDKGKPFRLSDVEVITLGKKNSKPTDTTAVKPEGGWQSFTEYLFSRLSKKDTLAFKNSVHINGDLELEFSFDEKGAPYNIKVVRAQDSTTVNEVISAVQNGPKWTSSDNKEKRLRLTY